MLRTKHPSLAFANAVSMFATPAQPPSGIDTLSTIARDATVGYGVSIGPFSSVGRGARVGDRTIIYPNVFIGDGAVIGDDCIIHSHAAIRERIILGNRVVVQNGAVIGADGYGFVRRPDGTHQKIPQTAIVVLEDDVEIGANTTIDRPAIGETRIQAGAKIDNLVQIGHGVNVGRNTLLAAQVGIAGSTTIGDDVTLAGQVGVAGHVTVGKGRVRRRPERHYQFGARRHIRLGLSGHREQGVAEIVGHFPETARVAEEDCRSRTAYSRAGSGAGTPSCAG